jgi:hypothetical protein
MSTTPQLDAWRTIAANGTGNPLLTVSRRDLALLITEVDQIQSATNERAAIAEADADRLAEALEVAATQADTFQQGNADRLLAAHREAVATRPE